MSGGGFLHGIHGASKAERARTASIEDEQLQVRSKTQAVTTHRQVDNFERRVARLMPELLVEKQEFNRPTQVVERLVGQSPPSGNPRSNLAPEGLRPPPPAAGGTSPRVADPFFSPLPPSQIVPQGTVAASGLYAQTALPDSAQARSDGFSSRDFDYERSLDALHLIGSDDQQAVAANAAAPLLEALENPSQISLPDAARNFLEANASYDLGSGRDEVNVQRMVGQLQSVMPATMAAGPRKALIEAMAAAVTVMAPVNAGDVSNALKLAFGPKEVFNVEAVSEATEAISSTPESEQKRLEADRERRRRDYVERVRREKQRKRRRQGRDLSEESTVSGLFRR